MRGWQLGHTPEIRPSGILHVAEKQEGESAFSVQEPCSGTGDTKRFWFRSEPPNASAIARDMERLFPEPVPGKKEAPPARVQNRGCPHPLTEGEHLLSPFQIAAK